MAAVTEGPVSAPLAAAEKYLAGILRREFMRLEFGVLVGAVTKGLFIAASTAAPVVTFTLGHFDNIRALLGH